MDTKVLTILFSDIKGFTKLTSTTSRENLSNLLKQHEYTLKPIIESFGGRVVKMIGDALLAVFDSPTNAVHCSIMMQLTLKEENERKNSQFPIHIRIALNTGEVELKDGDVYGEAVNVASRLETITGVDEIYFTDSVFLSMNRNEVNTEEIGYRQFKGIPHEVKIYRVVQDEESENYRNLVLRLRARKYKKNISDDLLKTRSRKTGKIHRKTSKRLNTTKSYDNHNRNTIQILYSFAVILFLGMLMAGGYYFFFRENDERLFEDYQTAIELGNYDKAEISIDKLYRDYQNSPYTIKAVESFVDRKIDELLTEKDFEKANDLLRIYKNKYSFLDRERWLRDILLDQAIYLFDKGDLKRSKLIFERLLMDYKDDTNIAMEYNIRFNKKNEDAKVNKDKKISEPIIDIENDYSNKDQGDGKSTVSVELKESTVEGKELNISLFDFSKDADKREDELKRLKKDDLLGDMNLIRFYYEEMIDLSISYHDRLSKAFKVMSSLSGREDWEKLKKEAMIDESIKKVKVIEFYDDIARKISLLLAESFTDNIKESVKKWLYQRENNALRLNAYYIYKNIPENKTDLEFYKNNLLSLDPQNNTRAYFDLVDLSIDKILDLIQKDTSNADHYKSILIRNKRDLENIRRKYQYDTKGIFKSEYIDRLTSMIKKIERETEKENTTR